MSTEFVLNTTGDPWRAAIPGLGEIEVDSDGHYSVMAATCDQQTASDIADAHIEVILRASWGEPLSFLRRGYYLFFGCAVLAPQADSCLLVTGDAPALYLAKAVFLDLGWRIVADGLVPITSGGSLRIHSRETPALLTKRTARRFKIEFQQNFPDSDVAIVANHEAGISYPLASRLHIFDREQIVDRTEEVSTHDLVRLTSSYLLTPEWLDVLAVDRFRRTLELATTPTRFCSISTHDSDDQLRTTITGTSS